VYVKTFEGVLGVIVRRRERHGRLAPSGRGMGYCQFLVVKLKAHRGISTQIGDELLKKRHQTNLRLPSD
jgi:hypothetical protein